MLWGWSHGGGRAERSWSTNQASGGVAWLAALEDACDALHADVGVVFLRLPDLTGSGYSSPYSPRVANSIIRSRASAARAATRLLFFSFCNIGSVMYRPGRTRTHVYR